MILRLVHQPSKVMNFPGVHLGSLHLHISSPDTQRPEVAIYPNFQFPFLGGRVPFKEL